MTGASRNIPLFIAFRVLFNARFYYPVLGILFVDLGLSLAQYAALNVIWAVTILVLEIPSGALADTLGRRRMVVLAAVLMVAEMAVFAFAPSGNSDLLFWLLALNRVLSGAAEASASGADEALAYDSLPEAEREKSWPSVLASLLRWQSAGFFVAMLVGAALFDRAFLEGLFEGVGLPLPGSVTRWPVYATLGTSLVCLGVALAMRELPQARGEAHAASRALESIARGATAVFRDRRIWTLLLAALVCDSFVRLFLTFASNYNRLIGLPEVLFGVVSSGMALLGFISAPLGKSLVRRFGAAANFAIVAVAIFGGLAFVAAAIPLWGVLAVVPLGMSISLTGFFVSNYLNAWAAPDLRATVLSFRGVAFNIGYGSAGFAFAALTASLRNQSPDASENDLFASAVVWLPPCFVVAIFVVGAAAAVALRKSATKDPERL